MSMIDPNFISTKVLPSLKNDTATLLTDISLGKGSNNEFVVFIKPEMFLGQSDETIISSLEMIFDKFTNFGVEMTGIATINGTTLAEKEVMSSHYGYINQVSKTASQTSEEDKKVMAEKLSLTLENFPQILGGHEFLEKFPTMSAKELDTFWFTKKSIKLRSGFYFNIFDFEGNSYVLVNAFHPSQLLHFTSPERRIVLFVGNSEKSWESLRNELIGDTYPEKALSTSIRGEIFANPSKYGQKEVNIGNNGIHMSAGPFEALKEMFNFYTLIFGVDFKVNSPMIINKLVSQGVSIQNAIELKNNPILSSDNDLFSATELLDCTDAVDTYLKNTK